MEIKEYKRNIIEDERFIIRNGNKKQLTEKEYHTINC